MVEKIRGAEVVITGDNSHAEKSVAQLQKQIKGLNKIVKIFAAAFVTKQMLSFFNTMVTSSQNAIDQMSKMSRQTDGTTLGVQSLRRAADLSGVSLETMAQSAKQLNVSIGEMSTKGTGPAVDALKRLGITAEELAGLDIDQKFGLIADRMKGLNITAAEQQALLQALRIEHASIQNLLEGGSEAFRAARADVIKYGQALSDVDAVQIEQANDAMTVFREVMVGLGNQLAIALAPVLKGISNEFGEMSEGSVNFRSNFEALITTIFSGIGSVIDVVAIWRLRWNQLTTFIGDSIQAIVDGMDSVRTSIEDTIEMIPGMEGYFSEARRKNEEHSKAIAAAFKRATEESDEALRKQLGGEYPSEGLMRWLEEARASSQAAAEEVVKANRAHRDQVKQTTSVLSEEERKRQEASQIAREQSLEALKSGLMTQEETELAAYQRRLEQLVAFREQKVLTEEQFDELERRATQAHHDKLNQIEAAAFQKTHQLYRGLASGISGLLGNISSSMQREGEKQFGITKAIALAQAVVKGYESIVSSYAAGAAIGGPPVGSAFAAIAGAATAAQIAGLKSTTSSSTSTGGGAVGSSSPSVGAAPQQAPIALHISGISPGTLFTDEMVRGLFERMNEVAGDNFRVSTG